MVDSQIPTFDLYSLAEPAASLSEKLPGSFSAPVDLSQM